MDYLVMLYGHESGIKQFKAKLRDFRKYYPKCKDTPEIAKFEPIIIRSPETQEKELLEFISSLNICEVSTDREFVKIYGKSETTSEILQMVMSMFHGAGFEEMDKIERPKQKIDFPTYEMGCFFFGKRPDSYKWSGEAESETERRK